MNRGSYRGYIIKMNFHNFLIPRTDPIDLASQYNSIEIIIVFGVSLTTHCLRSSSVTNVIISKNFA